MRKCVLAFAVAIATASASAGGLGVEDARSWFWSFPSAKDALKMLPEYSPDLKRVEIDASGSCTVKPPSSWEGKEMFFRVETADGSIVPSFVLSVDGVERGRFDGDESYVEFDLTAAFYPGEKAAIRLDGVSDGAGFFEACAFARPKEMIREFSLSAEKMPGAAEEVWEMTVSTDGDVETLVCDMEGRTVAGPFAVKRFPVPGVVEWTPENPVCYKVVVNNGEEHVSKLFAFRPSSPSWRVKPGIPRYACGREEMEKAAAELREANCNAVTWADSPRSGYWRRVCDLAGILVLEGDAAKGAKPLEISPATKYAYRDWTVRAANYFQRIIVSNRGLPSPGAETELSWTVFSDGEEFASGKIELRNLAPGREAAYDMPAEAWDARRKEGTVSVRFAFRRNGRVVAEDQIDLVESRDIAPVSEYSKGVLGMFGAGEVEYAEHDEEMEFRASGVMARFSKATGGLLRISKSGTVGWNHVVPSALALEHDGMSGKIVSGEISSVSSTEGGLVFSTLTDWTFPPRKAKEKKRRVRQIAKWTVLRNGNIVCDTLFSDPVALVVPAEAKDVEWFGYGPWANAAGEGGAFLGRWRLPLAGLSDGSRGGVRALRAGKLTVRSLAAPFSIGCKQGGIALLSVDGRLTFEMSASKVPLTAGVADNGDMILPERWCSKIKKAKK